MTGRIVLQIAPIVLGGTGHEHDSPVSAPKQAFPDAFAGTVRTGSGFLLSGEHGLRRYRCLRHESGGGRVHLGAANIWCSRAPEAVQALGLPFQPYTVALRLKRVADYRRFGRVHGAAETQDVMQLAWTVPNFAAVMLDDTFTGKAEGSVPSSRLTTACGAAGVGGRIGFIDILTTLYWRLSTCRSATTDDRRHQPVGSPGSAEPGANLARLEGPPGARLLLGCWSTTSNVAA